MKINYEIKQNNYTFKNPIEELSDISLIKGPNGSGKSTILNLLAYTLFGSTMEIQEELLEKIDKLYANNRIQQFKCDIKIENKKNKLVIEAHKSKFDTDDIKVLVNGEIYNEARFKNQFNIIYDIPDQPTKRIKKIIEDIKKRQSKYKSDVINFKEEIMKIQHEIDQYKPEIIEVKRKTLEKLKIGFEETTKQKDDLESVLSNIKQVFFRYQIKKYEEMKELAIKEIKKCKDEIAKLPPVNFVEEPEIISKLKNTQGEIKEKIDALIENFEIIQTIFDDFKIKAKLINESDKRYLEKYNYKEIGNEQIMQKINEIQSKIDEGDKYLKSNEDIKYSQVLHQIIDIFQKHKDIQGEIPFFNENVNNIIQNITDIISKLPQIPNEYKWKIESVNKCADIIDKKTKDIDELYEKFLKGDGGKGIKEKYLRLISIIRDNETKRNKFSRKIMEYQNRAKLNGIILNLKCDDITLPKNINIKTEEETNRYIAEKDKKLTELQNGIEEDKKTINSLEGDIKLFENQKIPKWFDNKDCIKVIEQKIKKIENRLDEIKDHLDHIENKQETEENNIFYDQLYQFLGKTMESVIYNNEKHKVVKVNPVDEIIFTENGDQIRFSFFGTGHTQSTYLLSRLNTIDNRKTIVLFDEVAMMDENSLAPIIERAKELYYEGRLILALIVHPGKGNVTFIDLFKENYE